jgi:hypothetical protein
MISQSKGIISFQCSFFLVHTTLGLDNVKKTISHNLTSYTSPKIRCTIDFNVVPRDALSWVKVNKCQNKHQKM